MKGQALAIAMVIVSGVATYVISVSTLDSLRETRAVFYRDYRFAELFVSLKRAPESAADAVRQSGSGPGGDARFLVGDRRRAGVQGTDPRSPGLRSGRGRACIERTAPSGGAQCDPGAGRRGRRQRGVLAGSPTASGGPDRSGDPRQVENAPDRRDRPVPRTRVRSGAGAVFPDSKRYGVLWMVGMRWPRRPGWRVRSTTSARP